MTTIRYGEQLFLFVPGDSERKLEKASRLTADVVILDLEDAVSPASKEQARRNVAAVLASGGWEGKSLAVRINSPNGVDCEQDLDAIAPHLPRYIVVPKVQELDDIRWMESALNSRGCGPGEVRLVATVETPRGVLAAAQIAAAGGCLAGLFFGSGDYSAGLGIRESATRVELDYARAHVALAAAAEGLLAIDAPYHFDMSDLDALRADTERGRRLGYHAKAVLHPAHLPLVAEALSPTAADLEWANRVMVDYTRGGTGGHGAIRSGNGFVDKPVLDQAQRILASAGMRYGHSENKEAE